MTKISESQFIQLLEHVERPQRYLGNEVNSVHKSHSQVDCSWVFCYPDIYEIGMSNLAIKIFYEYINKRPDSVCERVFAPWHDFGSLLQKKDIPLFSLESRTPVSEFDFLGITLQHELTFTNVIYILDLAKIPYKSKDRNNDHPIVVGGGPAAYNPEPMADYFDIMVIGEAEEIVHEIIEKFNGLDPGLTREEKLLKFIDIPGIYVPRFYTRKEMGDWIVPQPSEKSIPSKIRKRFFNKFSQSKSPVNVPISFTETIHDRAQIEIMRGCSQGCRFCMAGFIYRPVRERSVGDILENSNEIISNTGFNEVSFSSLNSGFYSGINNLISESIRQFTPIRVSPALPSLRMDRLTEKVLNKLTKIRKPGLTFAPEAGSQRLRNIINKKISEKDILETIEKVKKFGWKHLKLYFMLGLPFENEDDIDEIIDLVEKIMDIFGRRSKVTISFSYFIPKPFTPFQWEPLQVKDILLKYKKHLFNHLSRFKKLKLNFDFYEQSVLETVLSRGDRKIGDLILKAYLKGSKFDSWKESFNFRNWQEAGAELGLDLINLANSRLKTDQPLPWDFLDTGIKKEFFLMELEKAGRQAITPACREKCVDCGICPGYSNLDLDTGSLNIEIHKPTLENPEQKDLKKVIILFSKKGMIRFISHNDTLEIIKKALIRSGLKIKFTEGFNPLPKLTAAPALALGLESEMEAVEFFVNKDEDQDNILNKLNPEFPDELDIFAVEHTKPNFNIRKIREIEYSIRINEPVQNEILELKQSDDWGYVYLFRIPRESGNFKGPEKFLKENGVPEEILERRNFSIKREKLIFPD